METWQIYYLYLSNFAYFFHSLGSLLYASISSLTCSTFTESCEKTLRNSSRSPSKFRDCLVYLLVHRFSTAVGNLTCSTSMVSLSSLMTVSSARPRRASLRPHSSFFLPTPSQKSAFIRITTDDQTNKFESNSAGYDFHTDSIIVNEYQSVYTYPETKNTLIISQFSMIIVS